MGKNQETDAPGKGRPETGPKNAPEPASSQPSAPADPPRKLKSKPPRKNGPSVIIAPGPGSDVVATPPSRI